MDDATRVEKPEYPLKQAIAAPISQEPEDEDSMHDSRKN